MSAEAFERMKEWFWRALGACDFDLRMQDKDKGSSWKEATPLSLFNKMMRHVNLMMDSGFEKVVIDTKDGPLHGIKEKTTVNLKTGHVHAIKVANYALMIATRLAGDKAGVEAKFATIKELLDTPMGITVNLKEIEEPPEAKVVENDVQKQETTEEAAREEGTQETETEGELPEESEHDNVHGEVPAEIEAEPRLIIDPVPLHTGSAHTPSQEFIKELLGSELDPIIETGRKPLDIGPLPNGPTESKSKGYYCPWCEHTAKLGVGCRGKICCILCGKPINSRFADLLKKARQWDYVIMKEAVTSEKTAQYLGTSTSWAGKVLRELGWEQTRWHGAIWWRWNPPKEDGK